MEERDIINKYDLLLENFISSLKQSPENLIARRRAEYEDLLKKLWRFYLFSNYISSDVLKPVQTQRESILILYTKASLNFLGIYSCLSNGLELDATTLLRSLFETYINVELIMERDTDHRLTLYREFIHVERYNNLKSNEELLQKGIIEKLPVDNTLKMKIENDYMNVKNNYHPKFPHSWYWNIFSTNNKSKNPSLKAICEHLGTEFELDYLKCYNPYSISAHSSASIMNLLKTGNRVINAPSFSESIKNIAFISLDFLSKVMKKTLTFYRVENDYEYIIYIDDFLEKINQEFPTKLK